jgi:hypothetical protein
MDEGWKEAHETDEPQKFMTEFMRVVLPHTDYSR